MKSSESISNFLTFCKNICTDYKNHYDDVNKYDKETQDILHQLELGSYKERSKFATALSKIRKERRKSKDFVDINKALVEYLTTPEFIKVHRQLEQLLGICRKQEAHVENQRAYRARVRNDLTIKQMEDSTNEWHNIQNC